MAVFAIAIKIPVDPGYSPPVGDNVDFVFNAYSPPANDDVDFNF
jgi:hypothetical protein